MRLRDNLYLHALTYKQIIDLNIENRLNTTKIPKISSQIFNKIYDDNYSYKAHAYRLITAIPLIIWDKLICNTSRLFYAIIINKKENKEHQFANISKNNEICRGRLKGLWDDRKGMKIVHRASLEKDLYNLKCRLNEKTNRPNQNFEKFERSVFYFECFMNKAKNRDHFDKLENKEKLNVLNLEDKMNENEIEKIQPNWWHIFLPYSQAHHSTIQRNNKNSAFWEIGLKHRLPRRVMTDQGASRKPYKIWLQHEIALEQDKKTN